jgi:hypothetical protein
METSMESTGKISIELATYEALLLFEWLFTLEKNEAIRLSLEDTAEQLVLWIVEAQLEKQLVEPFKPNYDVLLQQARDRVKREH